MSWNKPAIFLLCISSWLLTACDAAIEPSNTAEKPGVVQENTSTSSHIGEAKQATTRLLVGSEPGLDSMGIRLAGLEIDLKKGWKTYWRSPGDSGVPPRLDWSKSKNLKKVEVKWPAPKRFKDIDGDSIGYAKAVILPLLVTPEKASEPVELNLSLFYGVCSDICVPVSAELKQTLNANVHGGDARIVQALEKVPAVWAQNDFKIVQIKLSDDSKKMMVEASFPSAKKADMFVERVDGKYMSITKKTSALGSEFKYEIDLLAETAKDLKAGSKIRVTMVGENKSAEIETSLKK